MILSSKGSKVLIVSDIHNESDKLRKILKEESADITISLGDYWHSFHKNTDLDVKKTCLLYNELVDKPNFVNLWGNHCCAEIYPNEYTLCSGFNPRKRTITETFLDFKAVEKTKWHCFLDDFLLTHAGLSPHFLPFNAEINIEWLDNWLTREGEKATIALKTSQSHWFFRAGMARGGNQIVGGLNWLDFNDEFVDIEGLPQIVGHTYQRIGKVRAVGKSFCIDTQLNQWVTITNKKLEIKSFKDL